MRAAILIALALTPSLGAAQQARTDLRRAPVPGGTIEYEVHGRGETVLLIHGAFLAGLLRPLGDAPALSRYRVIVMHRRGYAGSSPAGDRWSIAQDAGDAAALLHDLHIGRAHIVGHSSGAIVALELAATHPDLVRTLTLLDPPLQFAKAESLPPRVGGADSVEAFLQARGSPDLIARLDSLLPGALVQAKRDARRFDVAEWQALGAWQFDTLRARTVTAPVLVISEQRNANIATALGWWPGATFVEFPGRTHMFPFEAPDETATALATFFARHGH